MREDCPGKHFLAAEALAKREALNLSKLIIWCELGDLRARKIGKRWFVDLTDWAANGSALAGGGSVTPPFTRSPLFLSALGLFLVAVIAWTPLNLRFQKGSVVLTAAVGAISGALAENPPRGGAAAVYDVLWIRLERFWLAVDQFIQTFADNLSYYRSRAAGAWREFFGGETAKPEPANAAASQMPSLILDAAVLETLKAQIKDELLRDLGAENRESPGLVVLPASGDETRDEMLKLELKNAFSDQVEVKFDGSGRAGIITPIFQSGRGGDYLFILTPLKQTP